MVPFLLLLCVRATQTHPLGPVVIDPRSKLPVLAPRYSVCVTHCIKKHTDFYTYIVKWLDIYIKIWTSSDGCTRYILHTGRIHQTRVCVHDTYMAHTFVGCSAFQHQEHAIAVHSKHSSKYRMPQSHVLIPVVIFLLLLMFYLLNDHFTHSSQHGRGTSKREIWCCCCSG